MGTPRPLEVYLSISRLRRLQKSFVSGRHRGHVETTLLALSTKHLRSQTPLPTFGLQTVPLLG